MNMRHRITIRSDATADGEVDPSYTTVVWEAVPCNIVPVSGGESYRGRQLQAETNYVIETRYYDGLLPNQIAINDVTNETYLISRILNQNDRDRFVMMEATAVIV